MKTIIATVEIWKEWGMFTAYCPEFDVASCGHTPEEAKKNLRDTTDVNKWAPEYPICGRKITFVCYEKGPPIENDVFGCT